MLDEKANTGVNDEGQDAAALGQATEEEDIFGVPEDDFDAAEAEGTDQEQDTENDAGAEDESGVDPKAFAAKLTKERERIERETEERLRKEYEARYAQQQPTKPTEQQYKGDAPPPLPREHLEKLADDIGVTPEAANAMYYQQWRLNKQDEQYKETQEYLRSMRDKSAKLEALQVLEKKRAKNPGLPEVNEKRLQEVREDYRKRTGYELPWEDAYDKLVAQEAMSGKFQRQTEQETIGKITSRNKATIQAGKGGHAKKPDIWDMPAEEWNKLVEEAKAGKYKKS